VSGFSGEVHSDEGLAVDKSIKEIIHSKLLGSGLTYLDINFNQQELLDLLDMPGLDFVDRIIVQTCKKRNLVLLTDDADFREIDIPILSLNPNMF
jgi:predicted nucleic acid-binding protein